MRMPSHCIGPGDPSCMVLPRYCRFRRASHLHTQPTPLSLFSPEALYSVLIARSTTDCPLTILINLSSCPPLLISTSCLFLLSHHQQFICLDLFSHQTNHHSQTLSFGRASGSSLLNKTSQPVATACSTLSKSNTIPIFPIHRQGYEQHHHHVVPLQAHSSPPRGPGNSSPFLSNGHDPLGLCRQLVQHLHHNRLTSSCQRHARLSHLLPPLRRPPRAPPQIRALLLKPLPPPRHRIRQRPLLARLRRRPRRLPRPPALLPRRRLRRRPGRRRLCVRHVCRVAGDAGAAGHGDC